MQQNCLIQNLIINDNYKFYVKLMKIIFNYKFYVKLMKIIF